MSEMSLTQLPYILLRAVISDKTDDTDLQNMPLPCSERFRLPPNSTIHPSYDILPVGTISARYVYFILGQPVVTLITPKLQ